MSNALNKINPYLLIILAGGILFFPFLGLVHLFDWDEINFAESAREMLLTNDYFRVRVNFQPFWEKPPLFIWLQALAMKVFGMNEYAARFPNAITGIVTLVILFTIGRKHFGTQLGWWWIVVYAGSFLPHLYFKSGIIDPLFNLFIFLGIYFLFRTTTTDIPASRRQLISLAGVFVGLGVLTKGPVALLVTLLTLLVYFIVRRSWKTFSVKEYLLFFTFIILIAFCWFGVETMRNGPWFLQEFIIYQIRLFRTQDAGHGGPFIYHFIVLYVGCFPASVFIFNAFKKNTTDSSDQQLFRIWMIISFFVVLLLFSIVKTKIVHYSSFCYFPLTFFAAYSIDKIIKREISFKKYHVWQIAVLGSLIAIAITAFPLILMNKEKLVKEYGYLIKDPFALANLEAAIEWNGFEFTIGIAYFLLIMIALFQKSTDNKLKILFAATALVIFTTLAAIVPKIERFSQGAAIDFFKSLQDKEVYVDVIGYKSYAQLFYTKKKPIRDTLSINKEWLLHGPVDKDVFLVSKIDNPQLDHEPDFQKIGSKNGFVFYWRKAK